MSTRTVQAGDVELTVRAGEHDAFWSLLEEGRWEPGTVHAIRALAAGADLWIDGGAWVGPTALLAAAAGLRVVAYEPHPVCFEELCENVELNPALAGRIAMRAVALSTRDGSADISTDEPGDTMASLVRATRRSSAKVETVKAGTELARAGIGPATVLKLDIEGAEFAVLRDLARTLRRSRPTLLLSLHGYQLQEAHAKPVARLVSVALRLRLLPIFIRYPHWYRLIDSGRFEGSPFRELGLRGRVRLFLELSGSTLVFSTRPL